MFQIDLALLLITAGRLLSIMTGVIGLTSIFIGRKALTHSAKRIGPAKSKAVTGLVLGLIGIIVSIIHLSGSTGFGTGGGRAGAIVALVAGLIGTILSGLALSRFH